MKYFVHFTPRSSALPLDDPLSANKAAIAYIVEQQKTGTLEVGYAFVTGGGVGILNVTSHEELWELLYAYPLYTSFQWHVEPLADVAQIFSRGIAILEQEAKK
jgi:hypothetical protein